MIYFNTSEIQKTYYSEIRSMAEDYQKRIEEGEFDDRDSLLEDIHETLDGHQFVIYTHKAQCVCLVSSNDGRAADEYGADCLVIGGSLNWSIMAYCAMEADLYEALDSLGVDINDDDTFEREEEEEEEEGCDHTRDNQDKCHKCGVEMPG